MPECDLCKNAVCLVCKPNHQLKDGKCVACIASEGYDPIVKECYAGMSLNEFTDTQFGNLKAAATNVDLLNNYFLATYRYTINQQVYSHNGFTLFANNIENYNRMMDFCWDGDCSKTPQAIYFALANTKQALTLERFIVGTTSVYASTPQSMIFGMKTADMINKDTSKHKNFDCGIFGNLIYQPTDNYYGKCVNECQSGFYRHLESRRCIKCNENCETCIGPNNCSSCKRRYTTVNGECIACQSPCVTCEQNPHRCTSCFTSTMYNPSTFTCDRYCTIKKGCTKCDPNSGKCYSCTDAYELGDGDCEPKNCGLNNCALCTVDEKRCKICKPGYSLTADQCAICTKGCSTCPEGFQLNGDTCIALKSFGSILQITSMVLVLIYKFL